MKCVLDPQYNRCEHFVSESQECKNPDSKCSFRKLEYVSEPARKEKWFEKYYK